MRRTLPCWLLACATALLSACATAPLDIPHLEQRDGMTKLIVDGRPFICVGGELANSSSSDVQTMKEVWPRLARINLNTVLSVVSWDLIEPVEGQYDFSMIDYQLQAARDNNLRLIFLWMASWKNGLSHYPPPWVKANQDRFPRVVNGQGDSLEILSPLSAENRNADAKAFAAVMKHIREVDSKFRTVIAIQVENEVGVLGSVRDYGPAANQAFAGPVPRELTDYLQKNKDHLLPELKKVWMDAGGKTSGTWEEVFGRSVPRPANMPPLPNPGAARADRPAGVDLLNQADEIFMAWNYSRYIGYVAAQGKKEYPIPMYVNAWIVQPQDLGPGDYPSGGPEPFVHDIWRAGGPAIDILAPDIYLPDYVPIMKTFARGGNPAFNPETRQDADRCWTAFAQLNALCFSPMGIDNVNDYKPDSTFARTFTLVSLLSGAIAEAQGRPDAIKVIPVAPGQTPGRVDMGNYTFTFSAAAGGRGGGGGAAPGRGGAATAPAARGGTPRGGTPRGGATPAASAASDIASASFVDGAYVLILNTAPDEYYFATNGSYTVRVSAQVPGANITTPASIDRGSFINGKWVLGHRFNGDDIMGGVYDISGAAANNQAGTIIPLSRGRNAPAPGESTPPTILRIRFYHYK